MNFFGIKRLLARNQSIFRFTKRCFNLGKRVITYPQRRRKFLIKISEIKRLDDSVGVIWYCCVATHPNLGDLAQTICTLDWIRKNYPDFVVVELSSRDFYFNEKKMLFAMEGSMTSKDLILFQSGYTMTGVHENEQMRKMILSAFPDNRIVILPQTIFYQTNELKKWAEETYKDRNNLLLLARDRISYETAKSLFGSTQMALFPDIVTSLIGTKRFDGQREGVLFCVRDDWERLYSDKEMKALMQYVEQYVNVSRTDTTVDIADTENREAVRIFIEQTIEMYSHYKLIVTDRYHGTIFALIAGTPVVVLKTTDHKVITGAEWFQSYMSNYISVADTLEQAKEIILQKLNLTYEHVNIPYFRQNYYDNLKQLIEGNTP